jgi:hypothetical protein
MSLERGPISPFLEASAAAVGIGMVLGGFVAGLVGLLVGAERPDLELRVMRFGYVGAAGCLALRLAEMSTI